MVNINEDFYEDERVTNAAQITMDALEFDLNQYLDWADIDLTNMSKEQLEKEILIPAMERAYADEIAKNPELADTLPALPTQLETAVDSVLAIIGENNKGMDFSEMDGDSKTSSMTFTGTITSWE